jgi:hypothetical protein
MHNALFGEMVDILEYVVETQEHGDAINVDEMKEKGILGGYEVIYHQQDDHFWMFDYRFDRLPQNGCGAHDGGGGGEGSSTKPESIESSKDAPNLLTKTFYMPGRVETEGEPVTRSFRRLGYKPVDNVEDAQIIYNRVENETIHCHDDPIEEVIIFRIPKVMNFSQTTTLLLSEPARMKLAGIHIPPVSI